MSDLRCGGCGNYLGDNNAPIENGPHAGVRPTDMTTFCDTTGKRERVVEYASFEGFTTRSTGAILTPQMIEREIEKCRGPKQTRPDLPYGFPVIFDDAVEPGTLIMAPTEVVQAIDVAARATAAALFGQIPRRVAKGYRRHAKSLIRKNAKGIAKITNIGD